EAPGKTGASLFWVPRRSMRLCLARDADDGQVIILPVLLRSLSDCVHIGALAEERLHSGESEQYSGFVARFGNAVGHQHSLIARTEFERRLTVYSALDQTQRHRTGKG